MDITLDAAETGELRGSIATRGGLETTDEPRDEVIAFLESLTDRELLTDPALSDPWADR